MDIPYFLVAIITQNLESHQTSDQYLGTLSQQSSREQNTYISTYVYNEKKTHS